MSRWFGYATDATAGGTTLDDLIAAAGVIPAPTAWVPATTAQADPGENEADRNDEVRGRRGNTPSFAFSAAPTMTFGTRAYPEVVRKFLRAALGGVPANAGAAPASISSTVEPLQSGNLPAFVGWLLREGQLDRMTGLVVDEFTLNLPVDGEGTVEANLRGLTHKVDDSSTVGALPAPTYAGHDDVFRLMDVTALVGDGAGVPIDCLAGFGLTYGNSHITDLRSTHCAGKNVLEQIIDTTLHRVWYPERHKIGPQAVTGRLDFGDVRPDRELRRILRHAEKLVVEVAAGPLGTTPAADEMLRLTLHKQAITGGGAEPLQREGDQVSSYEFTAYIDDTTGKDVEATFVGASALT